MGTESRKQHRIAVALEVRVRGKDRYGFPFEEATASHDVSRGGCSIQISHEVDAGSELEIEILRRTVGRRGLIPFLTTGVVVRTIQGEPDQYTLAIQFTGPQFPAFSREDTTGG